MRCFVWTMLVMGGLSGCVGAPGREGPRAPTLTRARAAVPSGEALGARCAALGPPEPAPPPETACVMPPSLIEGLRPSYVPGGRWFAPAPRGPSPSAPGEPIRPSTPPRRPPPHQRFVPPRLELDPGAGLVPGPRPGVAGCLDTSIFRRKFLERRAALRCCLLASPPGQPETAVRIRFTLPCRGRAIDVQARGEPALAPRVARCLEKVVGSWQFPALRPGERAHIVYPLRYVSGSSATPPPAGSSVPVP